MSIEWDIEELAWRAMGRTEDEADLLVNKNEDVEEALNDKYGINFEQYCKIVKDLLPFTPQIQAGISGELFHAFVDVEKRRAIVKGKF